MVKYLWESPPPSSTSRPASDRLDAQAHAVASAPRRAVLERLAGGPASMTDLSDLLSVTLPAVDKHLRVLVDAGLVTKSKQGRTTSIVLRPGGLTELAEWGARTRLLWTGLLDRLADHLETDGAASPPTSVPTARGTATDAPVTDTQEPR